jgi:hypothetical protein
LALSLADKAIMKPGVPGDIERDIGKDAGDNLYKEVTNKNTKPRVTAEAQRYAFFVAGSRENR